MEYPSARLRIGRDHTESRDPAAVEELITRRYVGHRTRLLGRSGPLLFRSRAAWAGGLTVDHVTYGATVAMNVDPLDTFLLIGVIEGRLDLAAGRDHGRAGRGDALLYPRGAPFGLVIDEVTCGVAQIPAEAVTRAAARLGVEPVDFRVDGMEPVSPVMNRHWLSTAAYLTRSFAGPEPAIAHPLVLAGVVEAAAAAVVSSFPNPTMRLTYTAGPGRVAPAAVRRAVAFIDAYVGMPITLEDIAAASGVKVRGLQAGFARHRGMTPTGYLRRVRMDRAHRDLQAGDPARGDTVAAIARRWGFTSPGRFAVEYRKLFGRSPGETLRI